MGLAMARARRIAGVAGAFVRMGVRATFSYPLGFALFVLGELISVVSFLFLGHYLRASAAIGPSYLAFASIGLVSSQVVLAGVLGLGTELDAAVQQGRMEMLLIEPVSWRVLPVGLAVWQVVYRVGAALLLFLSAWALGARFRLSGLLVSIVLVLLAAAAGVAVGILAGSVRILSKRADPVAILYALAASLLAGSFVPLNDFPAPLRVLAWVLPTTYLNAGLRKALLAHSAGIYGPTPLAAVALLGSFVAVVLPFSLWLFGRSVEAGRRLGVLAGY